MKALITCLLTASLLSPSLTHAQYHGGEHPVVTYTRTVKIKGGPVGFGEAMKLAKKMVSIAKKHGVSMTIYHPISGDPFIISFVSEADSMNKLMENGEKLSMDPEIRMVTEEMSKSGRFGETTDEWGVTEDSHDH